MKHKDIESLEMYLETIQEMDALNEIHKAGSRNVWALFIYTEDNRSLDQSCEDNMIGYSFTDISFNDVYENPFDSYQSLHISEIDNENKRALLTLTDNEKL
jgi:hypothetical protein